MMLNVLPVPVLPSTDFVVVDGLGLSRMTWEIRLTCLNHFQRTEGHCHGHNRYRSDEPGGTVRDNELIS